MLIVHVVKRFITYHFSKNYLVIQRSLNQLLMEDFSAQLTGHFLAYERAKSVIYDKFEPNDEY